MLKINRGRVFLAVTVFLSLVAIGLAISTSQVGVTSEICTGGLPLHTNDFSAVPQTVYEDACQLAAELFNNDQKKQEVFVNQLLGTYLGAKDKDFMIVFNSGGWGWNLIEASPGWLSIFAGIEYELNNSGYSSILVTYQRTVNNLQGRLNEAAEILNGYSSKAKDLAYRINFLTTHIPDLRVIITGESNGTIICDQAMFILSSNPRVYSIQTGPPFWHDNIISDRTLVMAYNGRIPDSFSQGEVLTVLRANLRAVLGLPTPENETGIVLHFIRAPGHDYWWQYPEVYKQVTYFLEQQFGIESW